ncbi:DNA primase, partial [Candidatus Magnetomorum sp. HK-1]
MDNFKEIKSKADILNVIEQITKSKTKKQGETFNLECCPFCQHKDCFKINQKEQYFNCFSCSSKGDIHNFVQNFYQLDKYEALKKLAELTNYQLSNHSDKNPSNILIDIVEYYHKNLMTNKTLLDFQIKQRTHSIKSLKLMRVGLATGRLRTYLTKKGYSDKEQLETGLIKSKDGIYKDFFIKDVFVYPHKLSNNIYGHFTIKDHSKKFQYQLSNEYRNVECLFYNQPAFNNNEIILVEGENDVLSLMDAGFKNVIGICGQISEKQLKYLEQWVSESKEQKTIYLSFDNDDPGRTYTEKVIKLLEFDCYVDRLQKELG